MKSQLFGKASVAGNEAFHLWDACYERQQNDAEKRGR
jgi:hypothetical protein